MLFLSLAHAHSTPLPHVHGNEAVVALLIGGWVLVAVFWFRAASSGRLAR